MGHGIVKDRPENGVCGLEIGDYVGMLIAIAAQWRIQQAIGPAAAVLVGVRLVQPRRPAPPQDGQGQSAGQIDRENARDLATERRPRNGTDKLD